MTMDFEATIDDIGRLLEGVGVAVILVGAVIATVAFLGSLRGDGGSDASFRLYRRSLARAILLGLEFLVAGDIIRTVAIEPTFGSVGILAIIVAIRTFLSIELQLEIEGRWPWQGRSREQQPG